MMDSNGEEYEADEANEDNFQQEQTRLLSESELKRQQLLLQEEVTRLYMQTAFSQAP